MLSGDAGSQFKAMVEGMVASGNIQTPEQVRGKWRLEYSLQGIIDWWQRQHADDRAGEGKVEVGIGGGIRQHTYCLLEWNALHPLDTPPPPTQVAAEVVAAIEHEREEVVVGTAYQALLTTYRLTGLNPVGAGR